MPALCAYDSASAAIPLHRANLLLRYCGVAGEERVTAA